MLFRSERDPGAVVRFLADRGVEPVEWAGWTLLDAHERALGAPQGRERIKVVPRSEMFAIMRGER